MSAEPVISYFDSLSQKTSTMKLIDFNCELDKLKSMIDATFEKMKTISGYTLSEIDAQISFSGNIIVLTTAGQITLKFTKQTTTKTTETKTTTQETDTA